MNDEFAKVNPMRQVPALAQESFTLSESAAIMKYLVQSQVKDESQQDSLYPEDDLMKRAKIDEYLHWNDTGLRIGTNRYVFLKYFTKVRGVHLSEESHSILTEQARVHLEKSLDHLEARLKSNRFVASIDFMSLGDIAAICDVAQLSFVPDFKSIYFLNRPKLDKWYHGMFEVPAVKDTHQVLFKLIERSHQKKQ